MEADAMGAALAGRERKRAWVRFAVEAVLIVGSILLAFAIDAAWDGSQARAEEARIREALRAEFVETRASIDAAARNHERYRSHAAALAANGSAALETLDVGAWQRVYFISITTHPTSGTLDGLLGAGRLDVISDADLRAHLAAWPRNLNEFREQEIQIESWVVDGSRDIAAAAPISEPFLDLYFRGVREDLVYPGALLDYVDSEVGRNRAALRAVWEYFAVRDAETLLAEIDEILELLGSE